MTLFFYSLFVLLLSYTILLCWLAYGFLQSEYFVACDVKPEVPITIIICARNEQQNIAACLTSVFKQDYPKDKIHLILVNDASTDKTLQIAETLLQRSKLNYKIISNGQQMGKKRSITEAITYAANELIVLRDADTFTESYQWLQCISDFYQDKHPDMIIAPVAIADNRVLLWALQAIENNVLTLITCGSNYFSRPFLCSGANLIFTKSIFGKVNGYSSHLQYLSGDDVFFLEDVKKVSGSKIEYLKSRSAIVFTYPVYSFPALIKQKIRWASKFKFNSNPINFILAFLTFFVNAAWLFCFVDSFLSSTLEGLAFQFVLSKLLIDILLLFLASRFIQNKNLLWFSLPVGCIYPVYSCIVAIASLFVKPKWKN